MEGHDASAELYCLFLEHDVGETVTIGALGEVHWEEGWTVYVGRASYGWTGRLQRFAGPDAPSSRHWHVDYLVDRPTSRLGLVVPVAEPGSRECDLAGWFADRDELRLLTEGFGASDCTSDCGAHAFTAESPSPNLLSSLVESPFAVAGVVQFTDRVCEWSPLTR